LTDSAPPPAYYTPADLRKHFGRGWTTERVRRWLKRAGVLEKRHGTLVTTGERLASAFPEIYRRLTLSDI
jgi:hypothetical protein